MRSMFTSREITSIAKVRALRACGLPIVIVLPGGVVA